MKIKAIFDNPEDLNLYNYLNACGIDNVYEFMNVDENSLVPSENYANIGEAYAVFNSMTKDDTIYIVQDSDVDGICSASILYHFFEQCGLKPIVLFHQGKQHGLYKEIMEQIAPNSYVWLPDAGSNNVKESQILAENNVKVVCLDHHQYEPDKFNPAIIVNNQYGDVNHFHCGAVTTLKFVEYAMDAEIILGIEHAKEVKSTYLHYYYTLAAFGNISDAMMMNIYENKYINDIGLNDIEPSFIADMIKEYCKHEGNYITPTEVSWNIAPKLNAVCRQKDITIKQQLFNQLVNYKPLQSKSVIKQLGSCHNAQTYQTKKMMETYQKQIHEQRKDNLVILFAEEYNLYNGLIANKICSNIGKPVLVVTQDDNGYCFGSARSPVDLRSDFVDSGLFSLAQGHERAFGVGFNYDNIQDIKTTFANVETIPEVEVMYSCDVEHIPLNLFDEFTNHDNLWGRGVETPIIHIQPFTMNARDIDTLGRYGTTITFNNKSDTVTFNKNFVSKVQKEEWCIGENQQIQIELIGQPVLYTTPMGKTYRQIAIKEIEITPIKIDKTIEYLLEDFF